MNSVTAGQAAETAVAVHLEQEGYTTIDRNWKTRYAEIDIIVRKDNTLYFVEVKFRSTDSSGSGFEYITPQKILRMQRAADAWVVMHDWEGPYLLMAAAVELAGKNFAIDVRELV